MPLIARAVMEYLPLDIPRDETTDIYGKIISQNDFIRKSKNFRDVPIDICAHQVFVLSFFAVALDTTCMKS